MTTFTMVKNIKSFANNNNRRIQSLYINIEGQTGKPQLKSRCSGESTQNFKNHPIKKKKIFNSFVRTLKFEDLKLCPYFVIA